MALQLRARRYASSASTTRMYPETGRREQRERTSHLPGRIRTVAADSFNLNCIYCFFGGLKASSLTIRLVSADSNLAERVSWYSRRGGDSRARPV
jgi:hypothetical protein